MSHHRPAHEVELFRDGDAYTVYVSLPDCDPSDVELRCRDQCLHVLTTRRGGRLLRERVTIPHPVVGDVTASYEDGVLEVRLPVSPDGARPGTRVEIDE